MPEFDRLVYGGIPRGFLVAVTGEPGTEKTIFSLQFTAQGLKEGDRNLHVQPCVVNFFLGRHNLSFWIKRQRILPRKIEAKRFMKGPRIVIHGLFLRKS